MITRGTLHIIGSDNKGDECKMGSLATTRVHSAADLNNLGTRELTNLLMNATEAFELLEGRIALISKARLEAIKTRDLNTNKIKSGRFAKLVCIALIILGIPVILSGGVIIGTVFVVLGVVLMILVHFQDKTGWQMSDGKALVSEENARATKESKLSLLAVTEEEVLRDFQNDLERNAGITFDVIPEKYRMSFILNIFYGYISEGRTRTWSECIERFLEDSHKKNIIDTINRNHAETMSELRQIKTFTAITGILAGVAVWNSLR